MNINYINSLASDDILVLQAPYPWTADFKGQVTNGLTTHNHVIVLVTELHNDSAEFCCVFAHPRIHYLVCGFVDGVDTMPCMDWFAQTVDNYRNIQLKAASKLTPYISKPKAFDILLGQQKPHRQFIYDHIVRQGLEDKVVLSYIQDRGSVLGNTNWIWEPGVEVDESIQWTVTTVKYRSRYLPLSQIIPVSVYAETAYSVVAETNFDNHYSFYTEKIAKPILAERLFIAVSGQYYLRNLRRLGFQTFDGIVDESYDTVEDHRERFKMCCEQIGYLIGQPQEDILEKIRPITEHNKKVMLETDWLIKPNLTP